MIFRQKQSDIENVRQLMNDESIWKNGKNDNCSIDIKFAANERHLIELRFPYFVLIGSILFPLLKPMVMIAACSFSIQYSVDNRAFIKSLVLASVICTYCVAMIMN